MQRNVTGMQGSKICSHIYRRIRSIASQIIPAGTAEPYNFKRAQEYWLNVPRAQGGNPFNTHELMHLSDDSLVQEFDKEMEISRRKEERKVGFALAAESIADIEAPKVMDYGCGMGYYGFEIMARHHGAQVTFVDINEANVSAIKRIAEAKNLTSRVSYIYIRDEQARDLSFNIYFDLIVSMGVLHHTPYAHQIVRNLTPFLKDGGIFLVMLYNKTYLRQMESAVGRRLSVSSFGAMTDPVIRGLTNPYSEPYDDAKAKRLFQGYKLISAEYPDPCYNTYRFRKLNRI